MATDGPWLTLTGRDHLDVDVWQLDDLLDEGAQAEAAGNPGLALSAYRRGLPLWGGEPFRRCAIRRLGERATHVPENPVLRRGHLLR